MRRTIDFQWSLLQDKKRIKCEEVLKKSNWGGGSKASTSRSSPPCCWKNKKAIKCEGVSKMKNNQTWWQIIVIIASSGSGPPCHCFKNIKQSNVRRWQHCSGSKALSLLLRKQSSSSSLLQAFLAIKNKWKSKQKSKKKTTKPCGVQPHPLPYPAGTITDSIIIQWEKHKKKQQQKCSLEINSQPVWKTKRKNIKQQITWKAALGALGAATWS